MKKNFTMNEAQLRLATVNTAIRMLKEGVEDEPEEEEYQDAFESGEYDSMTPDEKYYYLTEELGYNPNDISDEDYMEMLAERRDEVEPRGWTIPDLVWEQLEMLADEGGLDKSQCPSYVVDNIAVNGDYGDFDEYKQEGESDEEFIERIQDSCWQVFPEERFVIISL